MKLTSEQEWPVAPNRLDYLDNLRFSLVALVICHHANAAYGSPGGWNYIVQERGGVFAEVLATMFAGITQAFFMSSFFMVSAYFTAPGYDSKGPWGFLRRRLTRLGIPLLAYYYVLSVVLLFFVKRFEGGTDLGFPAFFASRFLRYTSPGPLWFAFTLLVFEGVYVAWRLATERWGLRPRAYPLPRDGQILGFILGLGVVTFLIRQWQPLTTGFYHLRLGFFPLYVCLFTFGILAYRSGWFATLTARQADRWFRVSLAAIGLMPVVLVISGYLGYDAYDFWGGFNWRCYSYAAWEPFLCVGINMKLIVLYRDRFNCRTPFTAEMAQNSYAAYILHAFFIVFATYLFTFFSFGRIPEVLLMWPVAVIPCFLFAGVVRRLPLLNRIL